MKKFGLIIFISALLIGVVLANFTSFGRGAFKSPVSFVFASKMQGSGNIVTENRNTGEFEGVQVGGILNVEIKKSEQVSVVVVGDDNVVPLIKTVVKGGTLKIWSEKKFSSKKRVTIRVSAPNVENVDTSGVARVSFTGVSGEKLKIGSSGASKVELSGNVTELNVDMSGVSKVLAKELTAKNAKVEGSGASKLFVHVTGELNADVSGACSVKYSGDPSQLRKSTSGAGRIKKID